MARFAGLASLATGLVVQCWAIAALTQPTKAPEPAADPVRPALEIGLGLAGGTLWYVLDDRNVFDWDEPSAKQRLTGEAWRFDNNRFVLNYVWHPLTGGGTYLLARGNRLGPWVSLGYTTAASTVWEAVIEFKEKISINDMLVTPLAGLVVGEFFHKLALHTSRPSSSDALAWTTGLSVHGHRQLDGLPAREVELWNDLRLGYSFGLNVGDETSSSHRIEFDGQFVSLPGFLSTPRLERWFWQADFAALAVSLETTATGVGADAFGETLAAGYHWQNLVECAGRRCGHALSAGLGIAYHYRSSEALGYDDRLGLLQAPGLVLRYQHLAPLQLGLLARAYSIFGSMSSVSYPRWRLTNPSAHTKTVLEREAYFYGVGWASGVEGRLGWGAVELRIGLNGMQLGSVQGLDRSQQRVSDDVSLQERVVEGWGGLWLVPERVPLRFGVNLTHSQRHSQIASVSRSKNGERIVFGLNGQLR